MVILQLTIIIIIVNIDNFLSYTTYLNFPHWGIDKVFFFSILYKVHPSIFYNRWSLSHQARGGVHPGQIASPSQGHTETNNHTHQFTN